VNLVFTVLVSLVPGWDALGIFLHVLISTLILAPVMTFWVLPFVTRLIHGWLHAGPQPTHTAELSLR
jgi:antibiotic biosynthesis monooxygenase (ABM) superfamily enzyme